MKVQLNKYRNRITALLAFLLFGSAAIAGETGVIKGVVKNENGETLPNAGVKVMVGNTMVASAGTDLDGKYIISNLNPGKYDVHFIYTGYRENIQSGVSISAEKVVYINVSMNPETIELKGAEVHGHLDPIIQPGFHPIATLTIDELENLPVTPGDVKGMLQAVTSDMRVDDDGNIYMRGSRTGSTAFMIDGNRVIGSSDVAGTSISGLAVLTGGVPAEYGDFTGGLVVITTKDYMSGIRQKRMRKFAYDEQKKLEAAEEAENAEQKGDQQ